LPVLWRSFRSFFTSSAYGTFFPLKERDRLSRRRIFHLIRLRHLLKEKDGGLDGFVVMSFLRIICAFKFYFAYDFTSSACGTFSSRRKSHFLLLYGD
jgi:hypothetical protein